MTTLESTTEQTIETTEPVVSTISLSHAVEIKESAQVGLIPGCKHSSLVARDINGCAQCRHCRKRKVNRPRGLCWSCYYTPSVSNQYPTTSKFGRRGHGQANQARQPDHPTSAPPGSVEKLAVLAERAKRNMALWHPLDARYPGDTRPFEQTAAA